MMNIQNEVQNIHNQYGMSEKANYKIQLLCEQYAKEYHDSEVKKLNIPAVVGQSEQLKVEVFTLANKLAVAGEGDAAVAMHRIHNRL